MSAAPTPYVRQANFTSFEATNPTAPKPGASLDAEFNELLLTVNALLGRLSEIQRDDGRLANASVHPDSLSADVLALVGSEITPRGNWQAGIVYSVRDLVQQGGVSYVASVQHVSSDFSADVTAGRWQALNSATSAVNVPFSPTGGLVSTNVQAAIAEVQTNVGGRQPAATPLTQVAALGLTPNSFPYIGPGGAYLLGSSTTIGRVVMGASTPDVVRDAAGITPGTKPFNYVQLDGSGRLPAVDASLLFNVGISAGQITDVQLAASLNLTAKTVSLRPQDKACDYIEIRDQRAAGTSAGTFTSGSWQIRAINNEHADVGDFVGVATNQITVAAGTYVVDIACPAHMVGRHQARLRNITDGVTTLVGSSENSAAADSVSSVSRITGRFTIASAKTFEIQHQCSATRATDGFGLAANFGETEIYTVARFWKVG